MNTLPPDNSNDGMSPDDRREHARQVRMYCDGELPEDARRAFEARLAQDPQLLAELEAQLRNEQVLKAWVGRAIREATPLPPGMADRVRAALEAAPARETETPASVKAGTDRDAVAAQSQKRSQASAQANAEERTSWLTGPRRANVFAVAASLALVAGAVLFGIFGPTIDTLRQRSRADLAVDAVQFAATEHHRCASKPDARAQKIVWTTSVDAQLAMRDQLGVAASLVDLDPAGYTFLGMGDGGVPGALPSVQMVFAQGTPADDGCPQALTSVFVVVNRGQLDALFDPATPDGSWRVLEEGRTRNRVAATTDGQLVYFVVCCNDRDLEKLARLISGG